MYVSHTRTVAGVSLDPHEGVLHARSSQLVRVTVRPVTTEPYSCTISCQLISTNPGSHSLTHVMWCIEALSTVGRGWLGVWCLVMEVGGIAQW